MSTDAGASAVETNYIQSSMEQKIAAINARVAQKNEEASKLLQYLSKQREVAHVQEEKEEEVLKKKGIIIGQHVPSLKTKLDLDGDVLSEFHTFSSSLLVAKTLLDQNKTNFLRRTGNLPISDLAELKKSQNAKRQSETVADIPNYQVLTTVAKHRDDRISERFAQTLESYEVEKTKRREVMGSSSVDIKKKKKKIVLSAKERIANEEVLKGINHKLNYLRNPRNDPKAVTKMLVKGKTQFDVDNHQSMAHKEAAEVNAMDSLSEHGSNEDGGASDYKSRLAEKFKPRKIDNNPLFIAEPSTVMFSNYNMGAKYTHSLSFRNVSAVTRSFRALQPKTPVFKIAALKYPANCNGGMVAPGMSVSTVVTFQPDTLGDYNDQVRVETESGCFDVQLMARREPPNLSIPSTLNVGFCLVGDANRLSFTCTNTGGGGKFKLLTREELQLLDLTTDPSTGAIINDARSTNIILSTFATPSASETTCIRLFPFTLYPIEFSLMKNESFDLTIEFVPLELCSYKDIFFMTCDNGQVRQFSVQGSSKELNLSIAEINSVDFDCTNPVEFPDICFKTACVDFEQVQRLVVVNDTGLSVEYEWVWVGMDCGDLHFEGQNQITHREKMSSSQQRHNAIIGSIDGNPSPDERNDLIKSVQATTGNGFSDRLNSADAVENRVRGGRSDMFEVSPARGVMSGEGVETFEVRFIPTDLSTVNMRAVMMIKSVPSAALRGPHQQSCLDKLHNEGHGKYYRCRSWIEDVGISAPVADYIRPNGMRSSTKTLVNLNTVVQLVTSQAMDSEHGIDEYEYMRISKWVRQFIQHLKFVRHMRHLDKLAGDDGSSVASSSTKHTQASSVIHTGPHIYFVQFYEWLVRDIIDIDHGKEAVDNADIGLEPIILPALKLSTSIETEPIIVKDADDDEAPFVPDEIIPPLTEFTTEDRQVLSNIWVDTDIATLLLGEAICQLLDSKINHEAVDYLKGAELSHLAVLQVAVNGKGTYQSLQLYPPRIEVGKHLSLGKFFEGSFTIINPSLSNAEVEFDLSKLSVRKLFSTIGDQSFNDTAFDSELPPDYIKELISLYIEYDHVLIMPLSEISVRYSFCMHNIGTYEMTIPIATKTPCTTVDNLVIAATIDGSRLRYDVAEMDIGLVGVGAEGSKVLSFINEGDIPVMFVMKPQLHLDISVVNVSGTPKSTSNSNTHRSRQSTQRSDDYSVADSSAAESSHDFKIELKNAMIMIDPPSGVVEPQQISRVNIICKSGKIPQRIRGLIETRIYDEKGKVEICSQFLNLRGEVQAPKTKMYPLINNLGQVYVGQPVKFTISVENMCNLPTMYKLLRPGGESSLYKIVYSKASGPLAAKQRVDVDCTFTSIATGLIDDIVANKIFGTQVPLAFVVKCLSKGILLEFMNLHPDSTPPTPLASPHETQFPGPGKIPEPRPIDPIEISDEVPLYQRRAVQFAIRNFSAIPVPFQLLVKKFAVAPKPAPRFSHSNASQSSESEIISVKAIERKDLILAPHESGLEKFKSDAGKAYLGFTVEKKDDRKFLYSGLGASYFIDASTGTIPPWGVEVVTLYAFNDIPGCYDDEIECIITEGTVTRSFFIPVKMSVVGCPIVIEKSTVGMTVMQKGEPELVGQQLLQLGYACVNAEPLVREFYVRNHGSKSGQLKWQVKTLNEQSNGPIKVSYQVDEITGSFKTTFQYWEDLAKDRPFRIEPDAAIIPPYEKKRFKVTLFRTGSLGTELALLSSVIKFTEEGLIPDRDDSIIASTASSVELQSAKLSATNNNHSSSTTAINKFALSLLVEGVFLHPTIALDKHTMVAPGPDTVVDDLSGIILKAPATTLFSHGIRAADVCHKAVTLNNPLEAKLLFNVSTEGPYSIKDNVTAAPSNTAGGGAVAMNKIDSSASIASTASTVSEKKSTVGKTFNLYPNVSLTTRCHALCTTSLVMIDPLPLPSLCYIASMDGYCINRNPAHSTSHLIRASS